MLLHTLFRALFLKREMIGVKSSNEPVEMRAVEGDVIQFELKKVKIIGKVLISRENSVIVEIEKAIASYLGIENNRTVVSHRRYEAIQKT